MKRYLIVDCMSDYKEIMDIKGIKELLIEEVTQDINNNSDERDIVEGNIKILKKLALDTMNFKEMEEELGVYSFKIIDLLKIQMDIEDCKQHFAPNVDSHLYFEFNGVLDAISKGVE